MPPVKNSKVFRGGRTAPHLNYETDQIWLDTNKLGDAIEVRLSINSKGGGITEILARMPQADFESTLQAIARKMPGFGPSLNEATATSMKALLEVLQEERALHSKALAAHAKKRALARSLTKEIRRIRDLFRKPAECSEDEARLAYSQLDMMANMLWQL